MSEYLPILIVGAIIGAFTIVFLLAYGALRKVKDTSDKERKMADGEIVRRLLAYARPYWKNFILVFLVMLFSIVYDLLSPLIIGRIQGLIKNDFELSRLYAMVGIYAGILVVSMVCTYLQAMILQKTGQKILSQIRLDVFTHIEALSHEQLNNIPVGKLVTRVSNDPNAISYMFTNILVTLAKNSMVIVGVLAAMLLLNYALTLMVLCFVPFVVLFTVIFRKFSRRVHRKVNDATTDINTYLSENLSGMKITQIFNREEQKLDDFLGRSRSLQKAKLNRMFVFGIFQPMVYMLYISSNLCLFYFGAKGYIKDIHYFGQVIDSSIMVSFYMYISRFFNPIQSLAEQFDMLQRSFAAAEKIFTILDMVPEVVDEPDAIELPEIKGEIEFRDVWFCYKPDEWVLKGVSFHVEAKQTVAFVGSTGSGKTTILSLICRNYDIQKGQILIDGIDIRKIKISSLRRHFGQMLQDVFLFSGDIRSNILLRMNEGEPMEEGRSREEGFSREERLSRDENHSRDEGLSREERQSGKKKASRKGTQSTENGLSIEGGNSTAESYSMAASYSGKKVSDEDVWEACRYVNADSFIGKLDNGLDEIVRERGNNFSAGQRQLLSFARTIIHRPSVMILDEATANIDTETELLIQDSLEKMKNIGTMLIVAHRLSTIQHADNIILLSHGQIVEQGSHQELLHQKGRYYDLYTLQYNKQLLQNS